MNINNNFGCRGKKINPKVIIRIHYEGRMKKNPPVTNPLHLVPSPDKLPEPKKIMFICGGRRGRSRRLG